MVSTAFTAAIVSMLFGGGLWSRCVRMAPRRYGGEQGALVGIPAHRHMWPVVMPSAPFEDAVDQAHMTSEVISAKVIAEAPHEVAAVATPAIDSFEMDDTSFVIQPVVSVPTATVGENLAGDGLCAEYADPQPLHLETPGQTSTPAQSVPQGFTETAQPSGVPVMLLSLVVVLLLGVLLRSASSSRHRVPACQSQTACTGAPVPISATARRLDTISAPLLRAAGDIDEEIWEAPSPGAEGTNCGVFDDEPRFRSSVQAEPALEHKCTADVFPRGVLRVATPSRVRATVVCGQQSAAEEVVPQQLSF